MSTRLQSLFPGLNSGNYAETSEETDQYNCIAWAAGSDDAWWEPADPYYWPDGIPTDDRLENLVKVFEGMGYQICDDGRLEAGFEKIAVYGGGGVYEHAARQLVNGKWTSKIGGFEDIEHDTVEALEGNEYGKVIHYMRRPTQ